MKRAYGAPPTRASRLPTPAAGLARAGAEAVKKRCRRSVTGGEVGTVADGGGSRGAAAVLEGGRSAAQEKWAADLEYRGSILFSDGGGEREGERVAGACGGEQGGRSEGGKRRRLARLLLRFGSLSRSGDSSSVGKRRQRTRMDHVMNYAFQACSSNEERQALESAANASASQHWMHSNPQFSMHQQGPPYISNSPFPTQPPMQRSTEEQHTGVAEISVPRPSRVKLGNFKAEEDVNVTKWWVAISTDPVVNTGQKLGGLWFRIAKGYNSTRGVHPERSQKSLMNHWDLIKEACAKFTDYYTLILRVNPSGMSDADKTTEALARYAADLGKPFCLMHCWKHLKDEPKWQETIDLLSKTVHVDDDCYVTPAAGDSNQVNTGCETSTPSSGGSKRPIGRDTTKASRKKSAASSGSVASVEYVSKMHDLWVDRFDFMKDSQVEKNKHLAQMAVIEKEKLDKHLDLEERRLALEARRLAKEERAEEKDKLAEEERILNIDLDTCKPSLHVFYKAQQDKILAKYSVPPS